MAATTNKVRTTRPATAGGPKRRTPRTVATLAQKYIDGRASKDYAIRVVPDAVELHGETWYVVAEANRPDAPFSDFVNRITDAALDMEDAEKLYVMIVPTLPPDGD